MIRIFGGLYKGRQLSAPKGTTTRPSSGMLRQALFNICQGEVEGATVLDLFAGSGAVGIEALSRGAKEVSFVEKEIGPFKCLQENLDKLDCHEQTETLQGDVFTLLPLFERRQKTFDLIFADPPYLKEWKGKMLSEHVLWDVAKHRLLKKGALLFIEEGKELTFPETELEPLPLRRYGRTYLYTFKAV